jgi:hypothetical protein
MKPDSVFAMIYDAVHRACHDHHGHAQFPIAALHCGHGRTHGRGILSLGADLRRPYGHSVREAFGEAFGHGNWREHALGCQRQERGAKERPDSIAD